MKDFSGPRRGTRNTFKGQRSHRTAGLISKGGRLKTPAFNQLEHNYRTLIKMIPNV